jgi:DNA-binding transcriptional MerR regulator
MMDLKIKVVTRANGYSLAIDNEEFMYYTAESLIEGFSIRLGLERLNTMTLGEIGRLMEATKQGSLPKRLQKEVDSLNAKVKDQKKLIAELRREIIEMKQKYGEENDEEPVWSSN